MEETKKPKSVTSVTERINKLRQNKIKFQGFIEARENFKPTRGNIRAEAAATRRALEVEYFKLKMEEIDMELAEFLLSGQELLDAIAARKAKKELRMVKWQEFKAWEDKTSAEGKAEREARKGKEVGDKEARKAAREAEKLAKAELLKAEIAAALSAPLPEPPVKTPKVEDVPPVEDVHEDVPPVEDVHVDVPSDVVVKAPKGKKKSV